ncbi:hypothetical protein EDB87DRAFT_1597420 [Lactarius vividus]|nr:hypothetical protein EDB87DRAFT_1597420 [Lactarius vividus]
MGTQNHYPWTDSIPSSTKPHRPLLSIISPSVQVRPHSLLSDPLPVASFGSTSRASHIRNVTQGLPKKRKILRDQDESYRHSTTIGMLPDDVLKYLISVEEITTTPVVAYGIGTYWSTYVEDGDKLHLSHDTVSFSRFSANTALLLGRILYLIQSRSGTGSAK